LLCVGLDNLGGQLFARANQTAHEAIQSLRTIHSYNLQSYVVSRYQSLLERPQKRSRRNAFCSGGIFGFSQFLSFAIFGLGFWYGGTRVEAGEMTLENMLKVFFAILLATEGMSQAQIAFPDVAKGKTAVARIFRGAH
jgi:ATP-binding cassette, subfamily B (MDR/TAP), member 1